MVEVKEYHLPPTALVPNSPHPLLHYPGYFTPKPGGNAGEVYDKFQNNGWGVQWIYRYGPSQRSHYHAGIHECMAVLSGTATIRFGVGDLSPDLQENTHGSAKEPGGVEIKARAGDVFVLPAGTAHKTFDTSPSAIFSLLTPGDGHHIAAEDARGAVCAIELSGFTMMGAYPIDGGPWDSAGSGEHMGQYEKVWSVANPAKDPVLGDSIQGLCGLWK